MSRRPPSSVTFVLADLRRKFHFQLAGQVLPLELCVLADVGRDHPFDLLGLKEQAEAEVVHSGVGERRGEKGWTQELLVLTTV